jgi:hypothetical protein
MAIGVSNYPQSPYGCETVDFWCLPGVAGGFVSSPLDAPLGGLRREGKSPGALKVGHQAAEKSTISLEEM